MPLLHCHMSYSSVYLCQWLRLCTDMWIFLFLVALVPMFFFWSESATTLFPGLQKFFPAKASPVTEQLNTADGAPAGPTQGAGQWHAASGREGYVAWTLSRDGTYRLAVGCRPAAQPALQITHAASGKGLADGFQLNYGYGMLALGAGVYSASDVVGAVAQFADLVLETRNRSVLAEFNVSAVESGGIARALQNECAPFPQSH